MTPQQFQEAHGAWLSSVIMDVKGQALLGVLSSIQPPHAISEHTHLFARESGKREGFESCLKTLVALSYAPKVQTEAEANYGVVESKEEAPE